ncbi:MAG: hypothetical protein ACLUNZ_07720 [Evtepia sp.]
MASKKTTPQDGLRLAALTTMEWLRLRLGDTVPKELLLPGPEEFRSCSEEALQSLHLNAGFVIDIVSLPEQGAWVYRLQSQTLARIQEIRNRPAKLFQGGSSRRT